MKLENCPECSGEITLYSRCLVDTDYNCFARCGKCGKEYPMPEAWLATRGVKIYPASIKKAERCWNRRASSLRNHREEAPAEENQCTK